ncbi:MAG: hypothetical protein RMJ31_07740 [Nitrososphaerota archaeon]|nr:hypothetical protein [Nitrososphaerota archaeon]
MLSSYEKGRNAEYLIMRKLRSMGYEWIIRSSGSHTPIDLLASNGNEIIAIQCKVSGYLNTNERDEFMKWAKYFNAKPILAKKVKSRWIFKALDEVREG